MLNDAKIRAAKPREAAYKMTDSEQLFLHVSTAGGKHWRMNYTFGRNAAGKPAQKTLSLGAYPAVSLVDARKKRDDAKEALRKGRDPSAVKKEAEAARTAAAEHTFRLVAERWFELKSGWSLAKYRAWRKANPDRRWTKDHVGLWIDRPHGSWDPRHADKVIASLEENLFPAIGGTAIADVKAPKLLAVLNKVEQRGAIETAHRLRQRASAIFVYAIAAGICDNDPAASLGKALNKKPPAVRQPSIVDEHEDVGHQLSAIQQMLRYCEELRSRATTKHALRFLALTAVRPGEIAGARWSELEDIEPRYGERDGEKVQINTPTWRIPAARMKGDKDRKAEKGGDHVVPLARQAVEVIEALRPLTGRYDLMFPTDRHIHKPLSEGTLRAFLIRAGYYQRHVPHGFRSAFSTIMNQLFPADRAVIDLMLAHVPKDKVESAYNRAAHMPRRRELAQEWADRLLDGFAAPDGFAGQPMRWAATGPGGSH